MYSACLFCNRSLGRNELIEQFPVGRRLAFDADKGRLWVVCPHCRQWNLTPLEERWEAIEDCERRFRAATRRVSTGEIGMARHPEGLELIRIGQPLRPEMAAWRYGPRLRRRRRRMLATTGALAVVGTALVVGGTAVGIITSLPVVLLWNTRVITRAIFDNRVVAQIPIGSHSALTVRHAHLGESRLAPGREPFSWRLSVKHDGGVEVFHDAGALTAARHLLAGLNWVGASSDQVDDAVRRLSDVPDPVDYFWLVASQTRAALPTIDALPYGVRLALEMAAHEETERRAMMGELGELAAAWRRAEEIAGIADSLLLPASVGEFFRRHRPEPG